MTFGGQYENKPLLTKENNDKNRKLIKERVLHQINLLWFSSKDVNHGDTCTFKDTLLLNFTEMAFKCIQCLVTLDV